MDFVSDALFDGSRFRALTIVDNCSRECLAIMVGKSLRGADVVEALEALRCTRGLTPMRIQTDNGSEFIERSEVVFEKSSADHGKDDQQKLIETLYARIGELTVANDFLKKKV